jgi:MFS transporter, DHA1 family, inner membrane transport protein
MNAKERILLLLLAAINFTHILDFMIMMPLGNYLMPYFHISPQQFTFLVSCYTISAAISGFFSAFFVNAYDRKKVLLTGYIGFLAGTIACGFAPSYHSLLAARTLAGVFGGLIGAQVISIVSDTFNYERRGRAMGSIMSAFAVASTLGVPFALYLSNLFSWHAPFRLVGFLGIIIVPLIIYFVPPMTDHLKNAQQQSKAVIIGSVFKDTKQLSALVFSGLVMFGHFLIIPFINPFMEFNNGYSKDLTPLIYLVGGIASFIAAAILGRLSDRKGKLRTFIICVLLALPMIYGITHIPKVPYVLVLSLFAAWFIVATGRGVTAQAMVSNVVKPEFRGSFQSFNSSMQQLGTGLASIVTGVIVTKDSTGKILHYDWAGYVSMAVLFSTVFIAQRVFKSFETASAPVIHLDVDSSVPESSVAKS